MYLHWLRVWDVAAAQRVDHFVANSNYVARRIAQLYRRTATVIPPPVDTDAYRPLDEPRADYYVTIARLVKYKHVDLAIEACRRLGRPLHVIGDGPERAALEKRAGPTIRFLGRQPPSVVRGELARARALLYTGLEGFGIASVEAQAMGCPVIAYGAGGVLDTLVDGVTGVLFEAQTVESLSAAMERAAQLRFDPHTLREHALKFSTACFKTRLNQFVEERWHEFRRA